MEKLAFLDFWGNDNMDEALKAEGLTREDLQKNFAAYTVQLEHGNGVTLYKNYEGPLEEKHKEWVIHDLKADLESLEYLKVIEAFWKIDLLEPLKSERLKIAWENADLNELATEMVNFRESGIESVLVFDGEDLFVVGDTGNTYTPGYNCLARLKPGYNDLTETDDVLRTFFDDVPLEKWDDLGKEIEDANLDTISEIMKRETGNDYAEYERLTLIDQVFEWLYNTLCEAVKTIDNNDDEEY